MSDAVADPHAPYTVYKADMSYFSGKFEAYMRYKQIDHSAVDTDRECRRCHNQRHGSRSVVVWEESLYTAEQRAP